MTPRTAYLLAGATVVAGALVLSGVRVLMVLGGLPLALILPGLALNALFFDRPAGPASAERIVLVDRPGRPAPAERVRPSDRPGRLAPVERILLVPALSLGTLVLGGLLVWAARAPLHRVAWLALTGGVTLAGLAAVAVRERRRPTATAAPGVRLKRPHPLAHVLPAALAVLLLAGATWLSLATSIRSHDVTVTTLSVVPPGPADATGDRSVQVDATGLAAGVDAYTLKVTSTSVNTSTPVTADENGGWTSALRLPANERLTLALYRTGETTPMRTVIIASAATG